MIEIILLATVTLAGAFLQTVAGTGFTYLFQSNRYSGFRDYSSQVASDKNQALILFGDELVRFKAWF